MSRESVSNPVTTTEIVEQRKLTSFFFKVNDSLFSNTKRKGLKVQSEALEITYDIVM